jgi:hypothetical protein
MHFRFQNDRIQIFATENNHPAKILAEIITVTVMTKCKAFLFPVVYMDSSPAQG